MTSLLLFAALHSTAALAAKDDFEFELEGYYRVRANAFYDYFQDQEGAAKFMTQRLRLQPQVNYRDLAKFMFMTDVLDDVVWGDNQSVASTALFAGDPTTNVAQDASNGDYGTESSTFKVKRAWMEVRIPVGLLRVGRQPSSWGMGLLANSGDGFDDPFGENHYGSTYDRVIFATKPISIASAIAGKPDKEIPLFLAIGVDRLVEDPLIQYYGYKCSRTDAADVAIEEGNEDYDPRCDPDSQGYHTLEHDYTEDRDPSNRNSSWWADNGDDVYEMVYALIYRGEGIDLGSSAADITAGAYVVNRTQKETHSNVLIPDVYLRFLWKGIYFEAEGLHIGGKTSAIVLPGAYDPSGAVADPLYKEANIWGYVVKGGYKQLAYEAIFEYGYASGDDNPADEKFTGRAIHPDYNVGLILYEEVLARVTAATWTAEAYGLWSNGGVYNSRYIFPQARYRPLDNWEISGAFLMAWPDKPDGSRILCAEGDKVTCSNYDATSKSLGWEADLAVKHTFHNHVLFSLEGGYARITDRVPLEVAGLDPKGRFITVQSRFAYEF